MQPTYLPWLGYFDLIDQSTIFVFLDNVQFEKRSWQQRNRIRTPKGIEWLTVPVRSKDRYHQLIREVEIGRSSKFPNEHIRAIEFNYKKARYFNKYFSKLSEILDRGETLLYKLNIYLIQWLASEIGTEAEFKLSSELEAKGKRCELLVDICKRVDASSYLSPIGAAFYLGEEYEVFQKNDIDMLFHNYGHPVYQQVFKPFIPYASVLDLLLNEGNKALEIIRSCRNEPLTLRSVLEGDVNHDRDD